MTLRVSWTLAMTALLACTSVHAQSFGCAVSATGIAFGVYDPLAALPTLGNSRVTVSCTLKNPPPVTVPYIVSFSTGFSGTNAPRLMTSPGGTMQYNLYIDAARTQIWGNGSGGSQAVSGSINVRPPPGSTTQALHDVYGAIPPGQDVAVGAYIDVIVVTLTF